MSENSYTTLAQDAVIRFSQETAKADNRTYRSVELLLDSMEQGNYVVTPGRFVCRSIVRYASELLSKTENWQLKALLEKPVHTWTAGERAVVGEALFKKFGPLWEPTGVSWQGILNRGLSTNQTGSHCEFFKIALCLKLPDEALYRLFLLNGRTISVHNPVDAVFFALRTRFSEEMTWQDVMDVLREYRRLVSPQETPLLEAARKAQEAQKAQAPSDQQVSEATVRKTAEKYLVRQQLTKNDSILLKNAFNELAASTVELKVFKQKLAERLAGLSGNLLPFMTDAEMPPKKKLAAAEKNKEIQEKDKMLQGYICIAAGTREYSLTASRTLLSLVLVLRRLYNDIDSQLEYPDWKDALDELLPPKSKAFDEPSHTRLTTIFYGMTEAVGGSLKMTAAEKAAARAHKKAVRFTGSTALSTVIRKYLDQRVNNALEDVRDALHVFWRDPPAQSFGHDDILLLSYFLFLGIIMLYQEDLETGQDELGELENAVLSLPEALQTPFTRIYAEISPKVVEVLCDRFASPEARLDAVTELYNAMLSAFSNSGLNHIAPLYLPYAPDAALTAALLCSSEAEYEKLAAFMDTLLHSKSQATNENDDV